MRVSTEVNERDRLRRAGNELGPGLAHVTSDLLALPKPGDDWTVRDLVSHVVGESIMSVPPSRR
jgi:hypothetical protein